MPKSIIYRLLTFQIFDESQDLDSYSGPVRLKPIMALMRFSGYTYIAIALMAWLRP